MCAVGVLIYVEIWLPNSYFRKNTEWMENATSDDIREKAHDVLRYPVVTHHDAILSLIEHGNQDSVPYLLGWLKWHDWLNADDDFVECTKDHCLEALRNITGTDLGNSYADWKVLK